MSPLPLGTQGRLLEVDLDSRTARSHALDETLSKLFLGGRGLGTALLVERFLRLRDRHANPFRAVDPLAPENPLVVTTSPPNGTSVPTSARFHANFKSTLPGGIGSANSGGREYYESLGWDERGVPRAAAIEDLQIDAILGAKEFERMAGVEMQKPGRRERTA